MDMKCTWVSNMRRVRSLMCASNLDPTEANGGGQNLVEGDLVIREGWLEMDYG